MTVNVSGATVGVVIALGRRTDQVAEEDYLEESGSYQRLLAAMIDARDLLVDEDPILVGSTNADFGDEILGLRLDSL